MAKRSLRNLLRRKRPDKTGKKELSSEMRQLMVSFEAQYGSREPRDTTPGEQESRVR